MPVPWAVAFLWGSGGAGVRGEVVREVGEEVVREVAGWGGRAVRGESRSPTAAPCGAWPRTELVSHGSANGDASVRVADWPGWPGPGLPNPRSRTSHFTAATGISGPRPPAGVRRRRTGRACPGQLVFPPSCEPLRPPEIRGRPDSTAAPRVNHVTGLAGWAEEPGGVRWTPGEMWKTPPLERVKWACGQARSATAAGSSRTARTTA